MPDKEGFPKRTKQRQVEEEHDEHHADEASDQRLTGHLISCERGVIFHERCIDCSCPVAQPVECGDNRRDIAFHRREIDDELRPRGCRPRVSRKECATGNFAGVAEAGQCKPVEMPEPSHHVPLHREVAGPADEYAVTRERKRLAVTSPRSFAGHDFAGGQRCRAGRKTYILGICARGQRPAGRQCCGKQQQ